MARALAAFCYTDPSTPPLQLPLAGHHSRKPDRMRRTTIFLATLAAFVAAPLAHADHDHGHGHGHGHGKHKQEFWDGNCKVTREWKKDGEYKEKRSCRAPERVVVVPAPVAPVRPVYAHPPW